MPFFKRNKNKEKKKKNKDYSSKKINKKQKNSSDIKIKKKKKIGLRDKKQKPSEGTISDIDKVFEEKEIKEKKSFSEKKKKPILSKDIKGKPVFLEDTGEKLGTVFNTIIDEDKNIIGYKIKDIKSDSVLSFPLDNFEYTNTGLIFIPGWYTNALKTIEKLEFKDKISPELTALLSDDAVTNEELYEIFIKHDDDMVNYIDDAKSLRELLTSRLNVLEKERVSLKNDLMDLTEKRLIKDIDRKQFSEDVMNHRRKVNILDLNIKKCKDLIKRLDKTSFGLLGKNSDLKLEKKTHKIENNLYENILDKKSSVESLSNKNFENDIYKEKYLNLKEKYNDLEEEYKELKVAVDGLIGK